MAGGSRPHPIRLRRLGGGGGWCEALWLTEPAQAVADAELGKQHSHASPRMPRFCVDAPLVRNQVEKEETGKRKVAGMGRFPVRAEGFSAGLICRESDLSGE